MQSRMKMMRMRRVVVEVRMMKTETKMIGMRSNNLNLKEISKRKEGQMKIHFMMKMMKKFMEN